MHVSRLRTLLLILVFFIALLSPRVFANDEALTQEMIPYAVEDLVVVQKRLDLNVLREQAAQPDQVTRSIRATAVTHRNEELVAALSIHSTISSKYIDELHIGRHAGETTQWSEIELQRKDGEEWMILPPLVLSFSPDGSKLFAAGHNGRLAVLTWQDQTWSGYGIHLRAYRELSMESNHDSLRLVNFPGGVRILEFEPENGVITMNLEVKSVLWQDANRYVLLSCSDGGVLKFDTELRSIVATMLPSRWNYRSRKAKDFSYGEISNGDYEKLKDRVPEIDIAVSNQNTDCSMTLLSASEAEHQLLVHDWKTYSSVLFDDGKEVWRKKTAWNACAAQDLLIFPEEDSNGRDYLNLLKISTNQVVNRIPLNRLNSLYGVDLQLLRANEWQLLLLGDGQIESARFLYVQIAGDKLDVVSIEFIPVHKASSMKPSIKEAVFSPDRKKIQYVDFPEFVEIPIHTERSE